MQVTCCSTAKPSASVSIRGDLTAGWDVGEALVLASFPLAVADVEVDVDGSGESLVSVRRDFNQERVLQHRNTLMLSEALVYYTLV